MKVKVTQVHGGAVEVFQGSPEEVDAQLRVAYSWLEQYGQPDVKEDISRLGQTEALMVEVEA
jgi:hypothetical protein